MITEVSKDFVRQSHCLTLTVSAAAITALDLMIIDTMKNHEGESRLRVKKPENGVLMSEMQQINIK